MRGNRLFNGEYKTSGVSSGSGRALGGGAKNTRLKGREGREGKDQT